MADAKRIAACSWTWMWIWVTNATPTWLGKVICFYPEFSQLASAVVAEKGFIWPIKAHRWLDHRFLEFALDARKPRFPDKWHAYDNYHSEPGPHFNVSFEKWLLPQYLVPALPQSDVCVYVFYLSPEGRALPSGQRTLRTTAACFSEDVLLWQNLSSHPPHFVLRV